MPKIRRDKHGLYMKAGGYLFRLEVSNHPYVSPLAQDVQTVYQGSDSVPASHLSGALGQGRVGDERWYNHGNYMGPGAPTSTEAIYNPRPLQPRAILQPGYDTFGTF